MILFTKLLFTYIFRNSYCNSLSTLYNAPKHEDTKGLISLTAWHILITTVNSQTIISPNKSGLAIRCSVLQLVVWKKSQIRLNISCCIWKKWWHWIKLALKFLLEFYQLDGKKTKPQKPSHCIKIFNNLIPFFPYPPIHWH